MPNVGEIFSGIEQRFDVLSSLFERRQDDALEQGNMLFRELERRLNEVAEKFDQRQADAALDGNSIMKAIDARFSALAQSLDDGKRDGVGDEAIRGLETRLEGISQRLDQSASQFAGIDSGPGAQPGDAGRRPLGASCQAGRAAAGIRRHLAAAQGDREVDRRQPRDRHGGRAQRRRKRSPLARRQPAGNRGSRRPRRRTQGAGNADAPLRRAQLQDLRGDPRHASQDRRPHGLAGSRGRCRCL